MPKKRKLNSLNPKYQPEIKEDDKVVKKFIREVKGLKMYFNKDQDYCIIVDKEGNVMFEINADCGQNMGYLEDAGS